METWYLVKLTLPSGLVLTVAMGEEVPTGSFPWGKVQRLRVMTPKEMEEYRLATSHILLAAVPTLPKEARQ